MCPLNVASFTSPWVIWIQICRRNVQLNNTAPNATILKLDVHDRCLDVLPDQCTLQYWCGCIRGAIITSMYGIQQLTSCTPINKLLKISKWIQAYLFNKIYISIAFWHINFIHWSSEDVLLNTNFKIQMPFYKICNIPFFMFSYIED